jgi:hypothetical protein
MQCREAPETTNERLSWYRHEDAHLTEVATPPVPLLFIYQSCACRGLVVIFENLKLLSLVELEHNFTSLND